MSKARDEAVENVVNESADEVRDDDAEKAPVARNAPAGVLPEFRWSWIKNTFIICKREFWAYFDSPLAYVLLGITMITLGGFMFLLEGNFWQVDRATMSRMFGFLPWALSLVCAVITMRSLAEEKRMGTLELLITFPVRDSEVIMGKYFGALGLVVVLLLVSFLYPLAMFFWPWHLGPLDWGAVWTGYFGLVLWAGAAIGVGLLYSSLTESQIVSFFLTFFTLLVLQATGMLPELFRGWLGDAIAFVSFQSRYQDFARGLIDSRAVLYFVSIAVLALIIAFRNLESRKWK